MRKDGYPFLPGSGGQHLSVRRKRFSVKASFVRRWQVGRCKKEPAEAKGSQQEGESAGHRAKESYNKGGVPEGSAEILKLEICKHTEGWGGGEVCKWC